MSKKGQTTIFIIIAILVVAIVAGFLLLRNNVIFNNVPSDFEGIYNDFVGCVEDELITGTRVLESQGGYIYLPDFVAGSEYMPFSSQLNFLGNPVPYWYYVSGNNVEKIQVPSKNSMESELERFIEGEIDNCIPENFVQDYELETGEANSQVSIRDHEVQMNVDMIFNLRNEKTTSRFSNHRVSIDSELGNLYSNSLAIYEAEQSELFLEDYGLDVLRLYAPVDGVEVSCSPKIWNADEVFGDLQNALVDNVQSLKVEGASDDYFLVDSLKGKVSNDVRVDFLNSVNWSASFEVNPTDGFLMVANPVGNQQGLGALGFCYVPYHFVYSMKYPVMVQVYSELTDEIFQFPLAIVIQGNQPRKALQGGLASIYDGPEICENKDSNLQVRTYDSNLNSIDAEIYFECFSDSCLVGDSENGLFDGEVPQCANAYLIAKADGYEDGEASLPGVNGGSLDIILRKKYEMDVQLSLDSQFYEGEAMVTFENSQGESQTLVYPRQTEINLSEDLYEISVRIYENSSLKLVESVQEYCVDVPRTFGSGLGLTKQECFEVNVPEQLISSALSGGGTKDIYISEDALRSNGQILIGVDRLPEPDSLEQIQQNNILFDSKEVEVSLR